MAASKNSFILYCDLIHTISKLPDDKAGILFKHILKYVNDENPTTDDLLIDITFEPIKQQLKRDLTQWVGVKASRSESGRLGGLKSGESRKKKIEEEPTKEANEANEANASNLKQNEANEAVNVTVTVNDNVSVINKSKKKLDSGVNLQKIKDDFIATLSPFVSIYGKEMVNEFYKYWTEPNKSKTKLKFQMEKTWDVNLRLGRWEKNEYKKNKPINVTPTTTNQLPRPIIK